MPKARKVAAWVLIVLVGGTLVISAVMKLVGPKEVVEIFQKWNLAEWRVPIGILELVIGLLVLIPRTHSLGLLLASAYFGGAIATHLQQGEAMEASSPAIVLAMLWIGGLLRHSELLASFRKG